MNQLEPADIRSFVALGDSFTEGMNDPGTDGAFLGWADRLASMLAEGRPEGEFRYANLAVRGRLLDRIVAEQVPQVSRIRPDLVTLCAGGNDILRPGSDPDEVARRFEAAVTQLTGAAGTVVLFTGFDTRGMTLLKHLRGKIATYNGHLRAIADRHCCTVVDLWSLGSVQDPRAWSGDRLHLSPEGHQRVALLAARTLGLHTAQDPEAPWPAEPPRSTAAHYREDLHWARTYLAPWVGRRLRGETSGDHLAPKRPEPTPV
ncbi:SGNH/GDSL hydrolase family protein [Kitasatospora sp. NPDC127059]|uniref:SGNH/GDSL hydrolase family protein n=1 Tax=unclassified Kitasatospora TaxID=2633591 RepID=UPI003657E816